MKTLLLALPLFALATSAFAGDVNLAPGKTASINGTLVTCMAPASLPNIADASSEMTVNLAMSGSLGSCTARRENGYTAILVRGVIYTLANGNYLMDQSDAASRLRELVKMGGCN